MRKMRMVMGSLVGAALLAGSVAPAQARDGHGWNRGGWDRGGWGHRRHRGDGFGFGDALGVAALIGAVAIVANSVGKDKAEARDRTSTPSPPADDHDYAPTEGSGSGYDSRSDSGRDSSRDGGSDYDSSPADHTPSHGSYDNSIADAGHDGSPDLASEDSAVDACAVAARDRAAEQGGYAEVREIGSPQAADGGFNIDGRVERRASYRDTGGETRRFTCSVKNGRVAEVYLSRDVASN